MSTAEMRGPGRATVVPLPAEEAVNALTHFLGFILAVGGAPVLITLAALYGSAREVSTFSVYSATLILTYLASTLYHVVYPGPLKHLLHRLDHMMIYLLIAGTYTPFMIVGLGGVLGWTIFLVLWSLAAVGIGVKLVFAHRFRLVSTIAYILMGWAGLFAIVPMFRSLPQAAMILVLAGGVSYTVGAMFYLWRSLPHHHGIWHVFCLAGSVLQFIAVFWLLPGSP